jgi:hypothetical protein
MRRRFLPLSITVAIASGIALTMALVAASPRAAAPRRCVGMFVDPERKRNFIGRPNDLELVDLARIPCRESVMGWAGQGIFRVFDDGTVETLVSPLPPCPQGDFFLWIRYPG